MAAKSGKDKAPAPRPHVATVEGDNDRLTGALSKAAIERVAGEAIAAAEGGENIAIGYVGVDHFYLLNEAYGSLVTDQLLREIAMRIQENLREHDSVGRVTRDEFMIVFRGLQTKFETLALASKIRAAIAEPVRVGTEEEILSPGCGIAQYPANGKTLHDLQDYASKAMRVLIVAMRSAAVKTAQDNVNKAREVVAEAQAALEEAEAAYENALALVAASSSTTKKVHELELDTEV